GPLLNTDPPASWISGSAVALTSRAPWRTLNPAQQAAGVPNAAPKPRLAVPTVLPLTARNRGPSRTSRLGGAGAIERRTLPSEPAEPTVEPSNDSSAAPADAVCSSEDPSRIARNGAVPISGSPDRNEVPTALSSEPCTPRRAPPSRRMRPAPVRTVVGS